MEISKISKERINKYWNGLNHLQRLKEIKNASNELFKLQKKVDKSSESLLNYNGYTKQNRGGKRTNLYAKHKENCELYQQQVQYLRYIVNKLL